MRPFQLDSLFAPVSSLDGVGPKLSQLLANLLSLPNKNREPRIGELLTLLPHSLIDRRARPGIANAPPGAIVTLDVHIDSHQPSPRGRSNIPYRVLAHDDTGELTLTFFRAQGTWLERALPVGENVTVSGRIELFNGRASMIHPDHIAKEGEELPLIEPVYPLTAGLSGKILRKAILGALERMPALDEWIDPTLINSQNFPSYSQALLRLHHPSDELDVSLDNSARRRLAYDELLAGQLALAMVRARMRRLTGRPLIARGELQEKLHAILPFALTNSQQQAVKDISADLSHDDRMLRLLQGDVGSGKTVVALMAMLHASEAGGQSALMAPTEILARQHMATIEPLVQQLGLKAAVLTGREKGKEREKILAALKNNEISILIGTHALFQRDVEFSDLALAIIDEQHRFGVHQRLAMGEKGAVPDMLVMTATPIPRTLVLTAYGDMDVSHLTEKPAGRQPIKTVTLPNERLSTLVNRINAAIETGEKVYWICPLVDESELIELMSAQKRFESLQPVFGNKLGLVHGKMSGREKDEAMTAFKQGDTRLLIATTVIEVGVDVPDATIMVIEHAERFGLAQLHQLRGRVGRGSKPSSCVLVFKSPLGVVAQQRLAILRDSEDGFVIAEEDLKLRGEGEVLGTRQSGTPGFQFARLEAHSDLLQIARDDARLILQNDPNLESERGQQLRVLLYLFGRDEAIRLLRAG